MTATDRLDVVDVEGTDGIRVSMRVRHDQHHRLEKPFWQKEVRLPVPDEVRDRFNECLGDANATVTVGLDMKTVEGFDSAGASVYVKLTCNQDEASIRKTHALAQELAAKFVDDGHAEACTLMNQARGLPNPAGTPPKQGGPAKAKTTAPTAPAAKEFAVATTGKKIPMKGTPPAAKETAAPAPKPKTTGTKKPNFRRS